MVVYKSTWYLADGPGVGNSGYFFCNLILGIIPVIGSIVGLVTFIPGLAVWCRRLHDTDRSGKWLLLMLAPFVGMIILMAGAIASGGRGLGAFGVFGVLIILGSIAIVVLFLYWAAQKRTHGKNTYGPDPKGRAR